MMLNFAEACERVQAYVVFKTPLIILIRGVFSIFHYDSVKHAQTACTDSFSIQISYIPNSRRLSNIFYHWQRMACAGTACGALLNLGAGLFEIFNCVKFRINSSLL